MATIVGSRSILGWRSNPGGLPSIVDLSKFSGNVFFVDGNASGASDTAGHGYHPDKPFATWDFANGRCTADQGDTILILPGHAESIIAAGTVTLDVAGVTTIFLGHGAARGTVTFGTDAAASVLITAANVKVLNALCVAGIDGLTNPWHVQAADCELDYEWRDGSAAVEAIRTLLTTAAADRIKANIVHRGFTAGDAAVNAVRLVGCDGARINIDYFGRLDTGIVEFTGTASTNVEVKGRFHVDGVSNLSRNVVDTVTGSTWTAEGFDAVAGAHFSGGDAQALVVDDVGAVSALVDSVGTQAGSVGTRAGSVGTLVDSVGTQAGSVGTQAGSVGTLVDSVGTQAGSVGTLVDSVGTQAGSVGTQTDSVGTLATSVGTQATSIGTQADSIGTQTGSVGTQTGSVGTLVDSVGTQTDSVGTQTDSVGTLTTSVGTQADSVGTLVAAVTEAQVFKVTIADGATIPNNSQAAGGLLATATGGDVLIEEIIWQRGATSFTAATNLEFSTDNANGLTGADGPNVVAVAAKFAANVTSIASLDGSTKQLPFALESTKKLYIHGDDAAPGAGGTTDFYIRYRPLTAAASLA